MLERKKNKLHNLYHIKQKKTEKKHVVSSKTRTSEGCHITQKKKKNSLMQMLQEKCGKFNRKKREQFGRKSNLAEKRN